MKIGVPKEIKPQEFRVGLTPYCVSQLVREGHELFIEEGLGSAIGFIDEHYQLAGATLLSNAKELYAKVEMVVKVKEPTREEYAYLRPDLLLFCYLHLAANQELTAELITKSVVAIGCETVEDATGALPLLIPMSEVAGRLAVIAGAESLFVTRGGKGMLIGGAPGVLPAKVMILGAGMVGTESARIAIGMGADVTLLDHNLKRLKEIDLLYAPRLKTCYASPASIAHEIKKADIFIGAVLTPGKRATKLISRAMIASMAPGSVFVDVSIDQGGCSETSKPTTYDAPTYIEEGVVHYCVTNMPGAVPRTSSEALTNATMKYIRKIANLGWKKALSQDSGLSRGLNVCRGFVTHEAVASDLGYPYHSPEEII